MRRLLAVIVLGCTIGVVAPAFAQRLPFERSFDITDGARLDVSTIRGKIDVTVGDPGRVVVAGTVTVRIGWDVPANAADIARKVADQPPIERDGSTIRLRPPADNAHQRAVTVAYQVRVPRDTEVVTVSDSGATTIRDVAGAVSVRTQSGAIELHQLGATASVTTGSGGVSADGVGGALNVTTSSSAFTGRSMNGNVRVRTSSGAVDVGLSGPGDVDIETSSSAIRIAGLRSALRATTQSGRVIVEGAPAGTWKVSTGSGSVELSITAPAITIDATSGSGSVRLDGSHVEGTISKRRLEGTVGGGGTPVTIASRSGSIRLTIASAGRP